MFYTIVFSFLICRHIILFCTITITNKFIFVSSRTAVRYLLLARHELIAAAKIQFACINQWIKFFFHSPEKPSLTDSSGLVRRIRTMSNVKKPFVCAQTFLKIDTNGTESRGRVVSTAALYSEDTAFRSLPGRRLS